MKNTLWTFGCSFTAEWSPLNTTPPNTYDLYREWRGGNLPPVWSTILSEKLNMNLQNKGEGASGNDKIFMAFCNNSGLIKEGDIVIVGWTHILRYMLGAPDNKLLINVLPNMEYPEFSKSTLNEIMVNRDKTIWYTQIDSYIKMIINYCNSIGARAYFWTSDSNMYDNIKKYISPKNRWRFIHWDDTDIFSRIRTVYYKGRESEFNLQIQHETNGAVLDYHLGELGHKLQSDLIYNHIIQSENDI